jgi:hypothetical protein
MVATAQRQLAGGPTHERGHEVDVDLDEIAAVLRLQLEHSTHDIHGLDVTQPLTGDDALPS